MGKQFTVKALEAAKPRSKRYYLREGRGFVFQVLPSGSKAFVYIFELNKSKGYFILGHYPECSLEDARKKFSDARGLVKKGIDPRDQKKAEAEAKAQKERKAAEEAESAAIAAAHLEQYSFETLLKDGKPDSFVPQNVEQLSAVWVIDFSQRNHGKDWQGTVLSCIRTHLLPAFGNWKITAVRHKNALELIQRIASTSPGAGRNTMKIGRQIFKYACKHEYAEIQPFHEITESVPKVAPKSDNRHLSDVEIVKAWIEIGRSSSSNFVKRALKLILVTAQRPGEVAQMHHDQIDGKWWTIPPEVTEKNDRAHRVYLTDTALGLIGDGEGFVFPSSKSNSGHLSPNTLSQAINRGYLTDEVLKVVGNRKIKARKEPYFGMKPWSPHDLRRTARTNMARVGVVNEVAEEVISHTKPGLVGVYNLFEYDNEKKEALIKWEALLLEILQTKSVNI